MLHVYTYTYAFLCFIVHIIICTQVQTIINCLNYLDAILIGLLRKQNQLFDLQTDAGVKYLSLHVA